MIKCGVRRKASVYVAAMLPTIDSQRGGEAVSHVGDCSLGGGNAAVMRAALIAVKMSKYTE